MPVVMTTMRSTIRPRARSSCVAGSSGSDGSYSFKTIIPGHYLNGSQYRPAHIHVTVTAAGHKSLTTQLYFEGDPYNSIDPFIEDSLIMPPDEPGREKRRVSTLSCRPRADDRSKLTVNTRHWQRLDGTGAAPLACPRRDKPILSAETRGAACRHDLVELTT